ncbi:hypothetical protein C8D87_1243 [Lentzea atacamensis]|uniref:Uncharacterized protein n=2 Tax=Lentzea TaxID=165301 RepID=A0ABX9DWR7_9PSEU|nr:hypothetical protein C8D87_1243 [Lentzea atacamensis]
MTPCAAAPEPVPSVSVKAFEHEDGLYAIEFTSPVLPRPVELRSQGEVAAALHLAGQPLSRTLTVRQVADLVVYALVTVGVDAVRTHDRASRVAVRTMIEHHDRTGQVLDGLLPWSERRHQLCTDLASRLTYRAQPICEVLRVRADAVPADLG